MPVRDSSFSEAQLYLKFTSGRLFTWWDFSHCSEGTPIQLKITSLHSTTSWLQLTLTLTLIYVGEPVTTTWNFTIPSGTVSASYPQLLPTYPGLACKYCERSLRWQKLGIASQLARLVSALHVTRARIPRHYFAAQSLVWEALHCLLAIKEFTHFS